MAVPRLRLREARGLCRRRNRAPRATQLRQRHGDAGLGGQPERLGQAHRATGRDRRTRNAGLLRRRRRLRRALCAGKGGGRPDRGRTGSQGLRRQRLFLSRSRGPPVVVRRLRSLGGTRSVKPSDPPITDELATARAQRIRVGIGGWNFPPWRDNFYPKGLPQRRELEFASRRVTAIEINSTFYRAQKDSVYAKWRDETPKDFVFSLKAPRLIAEHRKLANAGAAVCGFVSGLDAFEDKLGPIVWQFPPSRAFERDDFAGFLDLLPRESNGKPLRHALEVRH